MQRRSWWLVGGFGFGVAFAACGGAGSGENRSTAELPQPPPAPSTEEGSTEGDPGPAEKTGMRCGEQQCTADSPMCAQDDEAAGGWRCVGKDDASMFKNECLTKADCGAEQECCSGMTTRCVAVGACDGGDTPLVACDTKADCPETTYGMPVKGCEPGGNGLPGLKLCQVQ